MSAEREVNFWPRGENQYELDLTAEMIVEDNKSNLARERLAEWNEARINGELTAFVRCSDARIKTPGVRSVSISNIAAAEIPTEKLAIGTGMKTWVVLTHLSSATIEPSEMPRGCGGLAAKGHKQTIEGTEIEPYVDKIADKDAFVQSIRTAEQIADISSKPTAAFAMDHLTYKLYPIAYFEKSRGALKRVSAMKEYEIASYDPAKIYSEGLPTIEEGLLPEEFQKLISTNTEEQKRTIERYPNLHSMQEVQNPRIVLVTTDIRTSSVKFPRLADIPGSIFKIHLPRYKNQNETKIGEEALDTAFRQAWYPLHQTPDNVGNPDKPFNSTDTLIIETASLDLSRELLELAKARDGIKKWLMLPTSKVILLQTNSGTINAAAEVRA